MADLFLVELLHELSMDLCNGPETLQAAVSYIIIFLLDVETGFHVNLPAPILHLWNCGVIKMLMKAEKLPVQINALGRVRLSNVDKVIKRFNETPFFNQSTANQIMVKS